jgi:MOSC domain-containing protein
MGDLVAPAIVPARRLAGRVAATLATRPGEGFVTNAVATLELTFAGIAGDRHGGMTRRSGGREPWYPRGTEMRNERQLSLVAGDELAHVAAGMDVPSLRPEWIGANLVIDGVPRLSMLPARTRLVFAGGAVLRVDGQNAPCRLSGGAVAAHYPGRDGLDIAFVAAAKRLRGLVAWVEKPGSIAVGDAVEIRIPEHWIYAP